MALQLPPRILIAGTHSGVGKTTIATGIMAALTEKGLPIQAYKVGPDYIDPSYHTLATGRPSRNLDRFMLREELLSVFTRSAQDRWAVIEGVMGLFDGVSGTKGFGSSGDIAKLLQAPVILIVDAGNMSRSVAAMVHGFCNFDPELEIAGVILNRVRSSAQETLLRDALDEIQVPILGVLPKEEGISLPERHLGLVPSQEKSYRADFFEELIEVINQNINLAKIRETMLEASHDKPDRGDQIIAKKNRRVIKEKDRLYDEEDSEIARNFLRLGVARDEAFSFYYQDALDCAENQGFTIVPFSPLHDRALPEGLDGIFFGGGFPELHLEELSQNKSFLQSLRDFSAAGKTIYAECGGYMYLGQQVADFEGRVFALVGLIPVKFQMTRKLQGMGYRKGIFQQDNFLGAAGSVVYGHEFHYSKSDFIGVTDPAATYAFELFKRDQPIRLDGYAKDNILASYLHLNFAGDPRLLQRWAEHIRQGAQP